MHQDYADKTSNIHHDDPLSRYTQDAVFLPADTTLLPQVRDEHLGTALLQHMERRLTRNPRDLKTHVQRILMYHRAGDAAACFDALVDLFIILGSRGQALRENLLNQTQDLLAPNHYDFLLDRLRPGLTAGEATQSGQHALFSQGLAGTLSLFEKEQQPTSPDDLFQVALQCIENGHDNRARRYLEQALEIDPGHPAATLELLALYRRHRWYNAFREAWTRLSARKLAMPEMWAALEKRLAPESKEIEQKKQPSEIPVSEHHQLKDYYLLPTPAGAFFAASSPQPDPMRKLLLALMNEPVTPATDLSRLGTLIGEENEDSMLDLLHQAQTLAWIQGFAEPRSVPTHKIAEQLEFRLAPLSAIKKGLLVDWNGFAFASHGIDDENAAALSALTTDIAAVERRHAERLHNTLGISSQGWAAVDAYGASRIGAWPLFISSHRFMIVLQGEPRLNQPEFVELIWMLYSRYGQDQIE